MWRGARIAVFRTRDDDVLATQGRCPHKAGLLADGLVGGGTVICPLHSYRYSLATGQPEGHSCGLLSTFDVRLRTDGHVALTVPAADTA